jgi:hypothetical protein
MKGVSLTKMHEAQAQEPATVAMVMTLVDALMDEIAALHKSFDQTKYNRMRFDSGAKLKLVELERELSARIDLLEKGQMFYCGTWSAATPYSVGSCVSHQGGIWHAQVGSTCVRPGTESTVSRLIVKSGRR